MRAKSSRPKAAAARSRAVAASAHPTTDHQSGIPVNPRSAEYLRQLLNGRRRSHAYLIVGPRGVGKTWLARVMANAAVCHRPSNGQACGDCESCAMFALNRHPDVTVVGEREQPTTVEHIRALLSTLDRRPTVSQRRVTVIDQAEQLTEEAANALLKSLEEPSGAGMFILTASSLRALPPTVVSRCAVVTVAPVPVETLKAQLIRDGLDSTRAGAIAVLSDGRPGIARYLATLPAAYEQFLADSDVLISVWRAPLHERLTMAADVVDDYQEPSRLIGLLERWQSLIGRLLRISAGLSDRGPRHEQLHDIARRLTPSSFAETADRLLAVRQRLNGTANTRLNIESLVLHLPRLV
ncbi:MAG: AAA family ATPase [Candidatus Kerfeldbacteria bacterium]|nr:AAA family ATPase [Candidatus Kerfeldbacteria bacterium]